jgi:hypothetical protein
VNFFTRCITRVNDLHDSVRECYWESRGRVGKVVLRDAKTSPDDQQVAADRVEIVSCVPHFPRERTNIRDNLPDKF